METKHFTFSQGLRIRSTKNGLRSDTRNAISIGKRMQTYTKLELATLFGVRISELGRLGRMGVFQRIGVDRYLLDYRQSALLLGKQERLLLPGSVLKGQRSALPAAAFRGAGPESRQDTNYQSVVEFYRRHAGFLDNSVNIVSVPELQHATLTAGMFLEDGLHCAERVVLLSFEHPDMLFARFAEAGLMFEDALETEQLIYLYYKPDVAHSISLSVDYLELFREVVRLGGEGVQRLVLFNVDALINANSEHLVHTSLHQLIYAANHYQVTLLGLFVASGHVAELLDEGCRAILPGYFVME